MATRAILKRLLKKSAAVKLSWQEHSAKTSITKFNNVLLLITREYGFVGFHLFHGDLEF